MILKKGWIYSWRTNLSSAINFEGSNVLSGLRAACLQGGTKAGERFIFCSKYLRSITCWTKMGLGLNQQDILIVLC